MIKEPNASGSHPNEPKKRTEPEEVRAEETGLKNQKTGKETGAAVQATVVHHMFAKIGGQNATEEDVHSWCNAKLEETINATTQGLVEVFLRKASHAKEMKNLSKENKILKFNVHQADLEKKKMIENHKLAVKQETEQVKKELSEAREEFTKLEKARDEATTKLRKSRKS